MIILLDMHVEEVDQGRSFPPRRACLFGYRGSPTTSGSRWMRTLVATHL
jgi:hypothetical protein